MGNSSSSLPPLQTVPCVTERFMGTWFVIGNLPTPAEHGISNAVETYTRLSGKKHDVDITFDFNKKEPITSKMGSLPQKGYIQGDDKERSGDWLVSPFWPVKLTYPIIEIDEEDYQYVVVGYPSRSYAWIMGRQPTMSEETYQMLTDRMKEKHGYSDLSKLRRVPQKWTKAERERRGFTAKEIPDELLIADGEPVKE